MGARGGSSRRWLVREACWLAGRPGVGPCDGRLVRAHLIPKQRIKREYPLGVWWAPGEVYAVVRNGRNGSLVRVVRSFRWERGHTLPDVRPVDLDVAEVTVDELVWDGRCWVPVCGGPTGCGGHHGAFDGRRIMVSRVDLPGAVEDFARDCALEWSLDRDYGVLEAAA